MPTTNIYIYIYTLKKQQHKWQGTLKLLQGPKPPQTRGLKLCKPNVSQTVIKY